MSKKSADPFVRPSYLLGFSKAPLPEGIANPFPLDERANSESAEIAKTLLSTAPQFAFVFTTLNGKPPTIQQMHTCIQKGYTETSDDPDLNDSYGLLLDTLRAIATKSPVTLLADESVQDVTDVIDKIVALEAGAIIQVGDQICTLTLTPIISFFIT
jgi:hypothetical protein